MERISRFLALEGNIRVLAVQTFLSQIGLGMFYVIWQPYLLSTGITVTQLGFIQMMINISTTLGLIFWGNLSDRIGRKPAVIGSSFSRILAILCLVLSGHYYALIAFGFLVGFTAMFMMGNPARSALIAESVEGDRMATALSTLITISQGMSTIVASAGGYIAYKLGYMPIFYVTIIGDVIGTLIIWRYIKETHTPVDGDEEKKSIKQLVSDVLVPEREQLSLYLVMLTQGFSYGVAYSLFYGALTDSYGLTTFQLGLMSTSFNLVWALDSIPLGKIVDRIGKINSLLMSIVMGFITVSGFILFKNPWAFIFFNGVSAIDIGFWIPAYTSYVSQVVSQENRSRIMGKLDAYGRIGSIPAPWLGGLLYERYGFDAPLLVQAVLLVVIGGIILRLRAQQES
jgi:MFS family permease